MLWNSKLFFIYRFRKSSSSLLSLSLCKNICDPRNFVKDGFVWVVRREEHARCVQQRQPVFWNEAGRDGRAEAALAAVGHRPGVHPCPNCQPGSFLTPFWWSFSLFTFVLLHRFSSFELTQINLSVRFFIRSSLVFEFRTFLMQFWLFPLHFRTIPSFFFLSFFFFSFWSIFKSISTAVFNAFLFGQWNHEIFLE